MYANRKWCFLFSPSANTKGRSNEFAEKNGLQKYEYVLHPRTTGFTFVVERLREGNPALYFMFFFSFKITNLTQAVEADVHKSASSNFRTTLSWSLKKPLFATLLKMTVTWRDLKGLITDTNVIRRYAVDGK